MIALYVTTVCENFLLRRDTHSCTNNMKDGGSFPYTLICDSGRCEVRVPFSSASSRLRD